MSERKIFTGTETNIPPLSSILDLGRFGASVSIDALRKLSHITINGFIGSDNLENYYIDLFILKEDGDTYIIRSTNRMSKSLADTLYSEVVDKVQDFIIAHKN